MNETLISEMREAFKDKFKSLEGTRTYFAPGRVNLIGEHIDYSGGYVFPCALTIGTYAVVRPRKDDKFFFYSNNIKRDGVIGFTLKDLRPKMRKGWTIYPEGVIWALGLKGFKPSFGLEVVIGGDIPSGAGLSSSASLEVLTGYFLRDVYGWDSEKLTNIDLALVGKKAENDYCGVNSGIMDQFASAMGKTDNAIYLNTSTLEYDYALITMAGRKIVVTNSNKPHSLVSSKYNERRAESDQARDILKAVEKKMVNLCDIDMEEFYRIADVIKDPLVFKRAHHAISENDRVKQSRLALKAGNIHKFADMINEAGESLRYDYEATCYETDVLVDAARIQPGVLCSRQTGGGWGGCTVSIVDDDYVDSFEKNVGAIYAKRTDYKASFYVVSVGSGPCRID